MVRNGKLLFVTTLELTADGTAKTNDQKTHQSGTNVPRLHKLLKCFLCLGQSSLPDIICPEGKRHTFDLSKAEVLNKFFTRQSAISADYGTPPEIRSPRSTYHLTDFVTTVQQITAILSRIDTRKSTSPDCLPARLLCTTANKIAPCLTHILT